MRGSVFIRALALLAVVVVTASCDALTGNKGSFTLTLSDETLAIGQGKSDTLIITLARSDYGKPVALTVTGAPTGVATNLLATTVPGNSSVTGLELVVAPTAALDTATLTVHATGDGVPERTATFKVAVGLTGTFTISSEGFPLTAAQSGGAIGTVLINRIGGHSDDVTLAVTGLPSGVVASFASSPTTSGSTAVSFSAASGAVPGAYNVTITGDAAGISQQQASVTLNIVPPPATASLSVTFCDSPAWFAYQNEGYLWQTASPVGGVYTIQATPTLAIAYVYAASDRTDFFVNYATRSELGARTSDDCTGPKTLTGTIAGASTGQSAVIAMGAANAPASQSSPNFTITGVADRSLDLVAMKGLINIHPAFNYYTGVTPDKLLIQRALNPANGASLGTLDFAAQGFSPAASNQVIANVLPSDSLHIANTFRSVTGTKGVIQVLEPTATSNTLYSVPADKFVAGDLHELLVQAYSADVERRLYSYLGALADRTDTLGPTLSSPTVTVISASPYVRFRGQLAVQPEYPSLAQFGYGQSGTPDRLVYVAVTAGFLGATPASTWDVAIPEFGSVAGLNSSWLLSSALVGYLAEADGGPGEVLLGGKPSIGDFQRWGIRYGSTGAVLRAGFRDAWKRGGRGGGPQYLRR